MLSFFYKHCERVTSTGAYIRELDGLRFLALIMVFLLHLNHHVLGHPGIEHGLTPFQTILSNNQEFGALGVQVFFAISGFILGMPFARSALLGKKPISLKKFYVRRLTRLEPPLIIHLTIMLFVYATFVDKSFLDFLPHYASTVTYLHSHLYGYPSPINPMTWSLEVEAQFYLCTPLLCLVFNVPHKLWRRALIVGAIAAFGLIDNSLPRTLLPSQLSYFLAGFLLAEIYLLDWKENPQSAAWGDLLAVLSVVGFGFVCVWHKKIPIANAFAALLIFSFFLAVFRSYFFRAVFRNRMLSTIGGMCYTFYLYHLAVIKTCSRILDGYFPNLGYYQTYLIYLVVIGAVNLVVCSALFALFERPFMKWRPRRDGWLNGMVTRPTMN